MTDRAKERPTNYPGIYEYDVRKTPKDKGIRYRVVYRTPAGKQTSKSGFKTIGAAKAFQNTTETKKLTGEYIAPSAGRTKISALAPDWLKEKKATTAETSYTPIEASWRNHVEERWAGVGVGDVDQEDVKTWLVDMRLAAQQRAAAKGEPDDNAGATVIIRAYGVLAGIMDMAVERGLVPKNQARGKQISKIMPKKIRKKHIYLTAEDVGRLSKEADVHGHGLLVLVLAYCGIRWGEAIALRVSDIDVTRKRLSITKAVTEETGFKVGPTKGRENRAVPVPGFVLDLLRDHVKGLSADALVFPNKEDSTKYLGRSKTDDGWFVGAVKRAKVQRITPHDLRHTCASLAISAGANVLVLSKMLGHKDPSVTLNDYADLFNADLDNVADIMHERYSSAPRCGNVAARGDLTPVAA
ncbi:tyrosine-type recombinase/integrase [Nocardia sp. NPDC127526]|uniref:tyrosine-type recombinase/integrase n=1 Tax=Nocardia sp. NPDC127526 TaxID=3345393 RepID=UPI00362EA638